MSSADRQAHAPGATFGLVEWFRPGEHDRVERALEDLRPLGVKHLRTGVSWADWSTAQGEAWYEWLLPRLASELHLLPVFHYTPPSLGVNPRPCAPPREIEAFAAFVALVLDRFGSTCEEVELWNEPNNLSDWDWRLDPEWDLFAAMIRLAAVEASRRGKRVVLGGMCPIDPSWLERMWQHGVLDLVDVVAVHGFPGTWDFDWADWQESLAKARRVLDAHGLSSRPIWITETAYSTWRHDERGQIDAILRAMDAGVERVYWSSIHDLDPAVAHRDGFHADERHYHIGLKTADGAPKLAYRLWATGGVAALREASLWIGHRKTRRPQKAVLITGGAGFIGTNLADRLVEEGRRVLVFDNLSRPGVEQNLRWLCERHGNDLQVQVADVRDRFALLRAVRSAQQVFHFAAQVAVTTSVAHPVHDFEVNALGTVNLLEALRSAPDPPPLVFTSTNKVYGNLCDVALAEHGRRYEPVDDALRKAGIGEDRPLDFHSPYGCSKGTADQYVLDYARTFGIPAVVLRMSCIYGPHQCGNEDQGWVAHFVARAIAGLPLTVFGTGKQVRDVLTAGDLVEAFLVAQKRIDAIAGQAFNIGGGPRRTTSLLELLDLIGAILSSRPIVTFEEWRPGDQRYYVSNTSRFEAATGWRARVGVEDGVRRLAEWLLRAGRVPATTAIARRLAS